MVRSEFLTASNCSLSSMARAALSLGSSLFWMKFMATNIPRIEPQGLKHCAMLRRRVAVASEPMESIYGLQLVSRNDKPHVRMKYAMRKNSYIPISFAGQKSSAPTA